MGRKHAFIALALSLLCAATLTAQGPQNQPMPSSGSMVGQMGGMDRDMGNMPMGQDMSGMKMGDMKKPTLPVGPLKITYGDKTAVFTPADLTAMPQTTVTSFNSHAKANETYTGVSLVDLLTKVGVPAKPMGKQFRIYLEAIGADGYEVVYSLGEVSPDTHDATVIVADTENGKPLAEDGPLKLIASREKMPSRWVRNLVAVKVFTAE